MNQDVVLLLDVLRRTFLAWIADEIEAEITIGKMVEKTYTEPGKKGKKTATTVEDYSEEQELEIALHCLANYLIVTPHVWNEATKQLAKGIKGMDAAAGGHVVLADPAGQPFTPFTADFTPIAQKLFRLLRDAWPAGPSDFDEHFSVQEESL